MATVKTDGLVLRYANYGENDRMLTLLTPEHGLLSTSARGCRKAASKRLAATELFAAGEYMLHAKDDRFTLSSFALQQNYYPIREDIDKLSHGVYWLNLAEAVAQPGQEARRLFKMLLLSLAVLAYGEMPCRALTAVFLMQFAGLSGFSPSLDRCARCGAELPETISYDAHAGGICCDACARNGTPLTAEDLLWLREAQAKGAFVLAGRRELPCAGNIAAAETPFAVLRAHVEQRLEKIIVSGRFL